VLFAPNHHLDGFKITAVVVPHRSCLSSAAEKFFFLRFFLTAFDRSGEQRRPL
jgi:hypothetical protein